MATRFSYKHDLEQLRKNMEAMKFRENESYTKDYRSVSVYPSTSELVSPSNKKLPCNIIKGPYNDIYEYLNTHFSLLREDFIKPLRESVITFLQGTNQKLLSVKIHEVKLIRKGVKLGDTCFCFEIEKSITYFSRNSNKFMMGSLLIFSNDNFTTSFCGRVADDRNNFYRKVLVSFEKPANLRYEANYMMIECNTFFEPYFQVLNVLKITSHKSLSMQKYLVEAQTSIDMPKYLNGIKKVVSNPELNKSQLKALNGALSQELVIIQGPPGTGKTFLGLKIVKELLSSTKIWYNETPMLIVSFTNHALDQFLQGLTDSTDKILRFGGQSKDPKMKNYTIRECRRRYYESSLNGRQCRLKMGHIFKEYCNIEREILSIGNQLDNIATSKSTCIFYFNVLAVGVSEMTGFFLSKRHDEMVSWLLEEDGTMMEENTSPSIPSKQQLNSPKDSRIMAEVYRKYLTDSPKRSRYCMISVSIIENAALKLHDRITEIVKGIENKRQSVDSNMFKYYLVEKKKEVDNLNETYNYLVRKLQYLKVCLKTNFNNKVETRKVDLHNPFNMPVRVRWQLYKKWLDCYKTYMMKKMDTLIDEYQPIYERFNEVQEENNLEVMRHQKIIGMTTTSAARLHSTIRALKCPIVLVEEAAEVLEAHIIPVLTEHCQHLILIGDHQQLKPTTADYAIETRYKLGVSLFERMIINNIQCHTLNVQHRMRPEISSLVTPSIYPVLFNHKSIENFEQINGVDKCLYFITHNEPEQSSGNSSKKNIHEAKFLIELAVYLLKNGYKPEEITILAAYLGQVGALCHEQRECDNDKVKNIKITSVDNFQGEENKIILLSLVRNNLRKNIGFLSIENRVCVALSRAKEGMYIMGNMKQLSSCSQLWQKMKVSFKSQEALGEYLPLKCQQHGEITNVRNAEDFDKMAPNGGCSNICNGKLFCGHTCQRHCHNDDLLHNKYKCTKPCKRSACKNVDHKCRKQCYQDCGMCMYPLPQKLHCGHHITCFMEEMEDYRCEEIVYTRLSCGHKLRVSCNEVDEDLECPTCKSKQEAKKTANTSYEKDLNEIIANHMKRTTLSDALLTDDDSGFEIKIPKKINIQKDPNQRTSKGFKSEVENMTRSSEMNTDEDADEFSEEASDESSEEESSEEESEEVSPEEEKSGF